MRVVRTLAVGAVVAVACGRAPIDDRLIATADDAARAPTGCGETPGAWDDLDSEPEEELERGTLIRWQDEDGCPIRVDVIAHERGDEHCGWQDVDFLTIGVPLGASNDGPDRRTYYWDPTGVFEEVPIAPASDRISVDHLPETAGDTGLRLDATELWLDDLDPTVVYRVVGGDAEVWRFDQLQQLGCA